RGKFVPLLPDLWFGIGFASRNLFLENISNQRAHALDLLRMDLDIALIGQFVFEDIPNCAQIGSVGLHHFLPVLDICIIVLGLCHCQGKDETDEYDQTSTQVALYTCHACLLRIMSTVDGKEPRLYMESPL